MRLSITLDGLKQVQEELRFSARRMNAAAATALTRTAARVRDDLRESMSSTLDRPTPYTLGALGMQGATASNLEAQVFLKDGGAGGRSAATYLEPQIKGGNRKQKGFERLLQGAGALPAGWKAVPAIGAKLDQYGNLDKGQLKQILVQVRRSRDAGPQPRRRLVGQQRKAGGQIFAVRPGTKGAKPGIYIREVTGRNITPILVFRRDVRYQVAFPFFDLAERSVHQHFGVEVDRAVRDSFGRLMARGG